MKINRRKTLFLCTIIMLGIGFGISFIYNGYKEKKRSIEAIYQTFRSITPKTSGLLSQNNVGKTKKADLSSNEDLTIAVMNLIGIEEHLFFTGAKTKKTEYYDLIDEVREIRKSLFKKLIPGHEGGVWCISKYLLATSYRLMEAGAKQLHLGNKKEAYELFDQAYKIYLLFWKLNKNIATITSSDLISLDPDTNNNKFACSGDIFQSDSLNKSCIFNDSKINCCAE